MSRDILIIGGGVVGLCTGLFCAHRGFSVTIVERKPARRDGCSFGNAGMIVPSHFVPLAAPGAVALALKWMFQLGIQILACGQRAECPAFRTTVTRPCIRQPQVF
jgi:glycine/D-amino acid oxidase-like deaminating enzyme